MIGIRRVLLFLVVSTGLAAGAASCHKHSPTAPCTTSDCAPVQTLTLTCPPDVSFTTSSYTVTSAPVSFGAPTSTGGTPPVTSTCAPASASTFSSGTTTVTCTATDAIARSAVCSFKVTVLVPPAPIPVLQGTNFMAFGDSLTEGDNGCNNPCTLSVDPTTSYPAVLLNLMKTRYAQQTVAMRSEGKGGEKAVEGVDRLAGLLQDSVPDALLLLEGVNDFDHTDETPDDVIGALRDDIHIAKARGVKKIFLATLPPEIPGGSRAWGITPVDLLTPTNALIRGLASDEGVVLVDLFTALNAGDPRQYVAAPGVHPADNPSEEGDGLHLTIAGRALVAQTFFAAIQASFEVPPSATARRPGGIAPAAPITARPSIRR